MLRILFCLMKWLGPDPSGLAARLSDEPVFGFAFSTDGKLWATANYDPGVIGINYKDQRRPMLRLKRAVCRVMFSPDSRTLATCGFEEPALFDVETGKKKWEFDTDNSNLMGLAFSPDGKVLATGGDTVKLWDVETGKNVAILHGHSKRVTALAFSPNGKRIASGSLDGTIRIVDAKSFQTQAILDAQNDMVSSIAISPDGKRLASCGGTIGKRRGHPRRDNAVRLWDMGAGKLAAEFFGHSHNVNCVAFSPDGTTLASSGQDGNIFFWDLVRGRNIAARQFKSSVNQIAFSVDGSFLFAATGDGHVLGCILSLSPPSMKGYMK